MYRNSRYDIRYDTHDIYQPANPTTLKRWFVQGDLTKSIQHLQYFFFFNIEDFDTIPNTIYTIYPYEVYVTDIPTMLKRWSVKGDLTMSNRCKISEQYTIPVFSTSMPSKTPLSLESWAFETWFEERSRRNTKKKKTRAEGMEDKLIVGFDHAELSKTFIRRYHSATKHMRKICTIKSYSVQALLKHRDCLRRRCRPYMPFGCAASTFCYG